MVKVETRWLNEDYFSPISGNNLLTLDGIQRSKEVLFLHDGMSGEFIHINEDYKQIFEAVQEEESDLDSIDQFVAALQGRPDVMVVILNQQVTGCGGLVDLKTVIGLDVGYQG